MDGLAVFGLQFGLTLLVCALLARWYVAPWLRTLGLHDALLVLTIPHALRHVGLVFLVPAVVGPSLPPAFAGPAAYGDLATALLALVALVALRRRWHGSLT